MSEQAGVNVAGMECLCFLFLKGVLRPLKPVT